MGGIVSLDANPNSIVGGGGLQAEPYATPRLSVPAAVATGYAGGSILFASRLGLRWRTLRGFSFGGGLGPTMLLDSDRGALSGVVGGAFDVETSFGHRWDTFALSATVRPAVVVGSPHDAGFYGIAEFSPAIFFGPRLALTGHVVGGPWVDGGGVVGFLGGGIGLFVHL